MRECLVHGYTLSLQRRYSDAREKESQKGNGTAAAVEAAAFQDRRFTAAAASQHKEPGFSVGRRCRSADRVTDARDDRSFPRVPFPRACACFSCCSLLALHCIVSSMITRSRSAAAAAAAVDVVGESAANLSEFHLMVIGSNSSSSSSNSGGGSNVDEDGSRSLVKQAKEHAHTCTNTRG